MTINEIEKSLQEKFNDEFTIKAFANFAFEFQECFSDILSTEELIQRIKKNVKGNIIVKDEFENKRLNGQYNKDGYICLKKSVIKNESYTKYLLFHEMLHAVTSIRDENGNEIMSGFSYIEHSYGKGLNEAMTEYLTQIRNEKFEKNSSNLISDYRTIVEQLRRLILIIGDKKIKECYFHKPMAFKDLLNETGMNYDEVESAFNGLCGQDYDVYAMGHNKKLQNNTNYKLHVKGLFLQDHPEFDYSEISYRRIKDKNSKIDLIIFYPSNNVPYGYTINEKKLFNILMTMESKF